jgi:hypothetical protein
MVIFLNFFFDKYRTPLFTVLFLLSLQYILAQTIVSGKIINANGEPLPFVHVRIENTNNGTVSNNLGLFKLVSNLNDKNLSLLFSTIGYRSKKVFLNNGYHIISLQEDITVLPEVVLLSRDYGKEIIQKVINAIPNNYPVEDEMHIGFFRETTTWEEDEYPIYITEAVIEANKKAYTKITKSGDVKLVELRKYESEQLDSLSTRIYAGSHHIHRFDMVARRDYFLNNINAYRYEIADTLRQYGQDIYKVYFEKKNKVSGYVYVMDSTFALIKAEIKVKSFFELSGPNRQFLNYSLAYEQGEDNIWRFKNSQYETAFKKRGKLLNLVSNYVTTEVHSNMPDIPYLEKLQFQDILLDETKEYKPSFWNNYNIISPDALSESLFKSIDYSEKENSKTQPYKLITILSKLTYEMSLNWTPLSINSYSLDFANEALEIKRDGVPSEDNTFGFTSSLFFSVKPNFLVGYSNESKLSSTGINSHDLVLAKNFNLNPTGRPIFISPRVSLGYQELAYEIGDYSVKEDFKIENKSFDSENVSAVMSQRGMRVKPSIFLKLEKSRKLSFLLSVGYNFPLNNTKGIILQEQDGFFLFRKKAFIKNGNHNLIIDTNQNDLLRSNITINTGISLKL